MADFATLPRYGQLAARPLPPLPGCHRETRRRLIRDNRQHGLHRHCLPGIAGTVRESVCEHERDKWL